MSSTGANTAAKSNSSKPRGSAVEPNQQPSKDRMERSSSTTPPARKLAMDSPSVSPTTALRRPNLPRDSPEAESSADEETVFVGRTSKLGINYRATHNNNTRERRPSPENARMPGNTAEPDEVDNTLVDEHQSWWARVLSEYGSLELENKGSVARDHLALERTFLAWLRTSLAFASIGIAITQLFRLNTTSANTGGSDPYAHLRHMGKPLGATFLAISIVMLFVGFHRYFEGQHWIVRGKFPASRGSIALVTAITFGLMITSLVVVVVVGPRSFEKRGEYRTTML